MMIRRKTLSLSLLIPFFLLTKVLYDKTAGATLSLLVPSHCSRRACVKLEFLSILISSQYYLQPLPKFLAGACHALHRFIEPRRIRMMGKSAPNRRARENNYSSLDILAPN